MFFVGVGRGIWSFMTVFGSVVGCELRALVVVISIWGNSPSVAEVLCIIKGRSVGAYGCDCFGFWYLIEVFCNYFLDVFYEGLSC